MGIMILLVDDNRDFGQLLAQMLQADLQQVTLFTSAEDAEAWLRQGAAPKACILDLKLGRGRMTGVELARLVRAMHPALPIVFLTGAVPSGDQAELRGLGAIVHKTAGFSALVQALQAECARHAGRCRP